MGFSDLPLRRRDLALSTAAAAAAVVTPTAAPAAPGGDGRHRLRPASGGVAALNLRLDAAPANARPSGGLRTPVLETSRFSLVGVTWRSGGGQVRARWRRTGGGWTEWQELPPLHDRPDPGSDEGRATPQATDLTWTGPCDAVQLELAGDHRDAVLALIHPERGVRVGTAGDGEDDEDADAGEPTAARGDDGWAVNQPPMRLRKAWGADPRLRNGKPTYNKTIKQAHVHHTVNSNSYGRQDVPGLIRAMYRYHTQNLGWADIGYNFLVDRFGRIWVGRAGGVRRNVRGAHTLGFNHNSVGIAVIGNFEGKRPNKRIVRSVARLAAWKLDKYERRPRALIKVTSWGSDKYAEGETVRLKVIDGHRDTNDTACPGRHLYDALPRIRRLAARRIRRAHAAGRAG